MKKIQMRLSMTALLAATFLFSGSHTSAVYAQNAVQAPAASLLIEDFTAAAGTALTSTGWTAHSAGGTNTIVTSAPGLTFTGYPSSGVGNAVSLTTSGEDDNRTFAIQSSGSVYAAFMVTVSDASTDPAGGYFFHIGPDPIGTTFRGRVFIKKDASNNISFGISKALTASTDIAFTPFSYSLNTTYLIVVKYAIVAGATNDTVSLYVIASSTPTTEPAPTVTATDVAQSDISPGSVALRQGAATTSPTVRVDGIRVGTDWASITQAVTPADAPVDFNGDGKTDFAVARNIAGQFRWFWLLNGGGGNSEMDWGLIGDTLVMEDFDGDGKDDVTVWRQAAGIGSAFYIFQSMTSTVKVSQFGLIGDDATVVGDYDGDGKADEAVYRPGAVAGSQSTWFYRGSFNNPSGAITYVPWGVNGDKVGPGDYDGDGKNDFVIRRDVAGAGQWWMRQSSGATVVQTFGLSNDRIVPGDYDGDGKTDLTALRGEIGPLNWYIQPSSAPGTFQQTAWGTSSDFPVQGDYDGDGKTDLAVWIGTNPNPGQFLARNSSTGGYTQILWGQPNDVPIAFFNRH